MLKRSELVLGFFVLAVVGMFLVPLPTQLLDLLLVLNISLSLLLLLVVLYLQNVSSLLAFPSLLLLATLFRLGLNVASTRLILTDGFAGNVIQSFGTLLIRGDVLVGAVIFTIVTIVNFIVITRGATRVSEVGARFALDAMPGKQIAIDSDLKSGVITPEEARDRRDELRRESQLYGAMDGAMRFIQGDAIASICIIVVNIIGGLYQGLSNSMGIFDAVQTYTLLTVGDGLVTQIPALITSICAGVVVTRVASSDEATLSGDLSQQLFGRARVLIAAAVLVMAIGFLPGIPLAPFLFVGAALALVAYFQNRKVRDSDSDVEASNAQPTSAQNSAEGVFDRDNSVIISLDSVGLMRQFRANENILRSFWDRCSRNVQDEIGTILPGLRVRSQVGLGVGQYLVMYNGVKIAEGSVPLDAVFTDLSVHGAASLGVPPISVQPHPHFAHRGVWVPSYMSSVILDGEFAHYSPIEFIALAAATYFVRNPAEILSLSDVHGFIKQLEKRSPGVVGDMLQNGVVSVATVTQLMHAMVSQGIPVRDFRQIVEGIASYCSMKGADLPDSFDFQEMLYSVRRARRRVLLSRIQASSGNIHVIALAEPVSRMFEEAVLPAREAEQLPPPLFESGSNDLLRDGFSDCLERLARRGAVSPPAIFVDVGNRDKVARFLSAYFPGSIVLTADDLGLDFRIDRVATWELGRASQLLTAGAGGK